MQRPRFLLLAGALSLLVTGAACGGGDGDGGEDAAKAKNDVQSGNVSTAGGADITATAKEFSFDPKEIKVEAGKATTISLKNAGAVEHDITIDSPAFKLAVQPVKAAEATLTMPTAGSYTMYCSVPGHREAGMEGTVTVS